MEESDSIVLKQRLVVAESKRDGWGALGRVEKYLEAYSEVQALELQLDRLPRAEPHAIDPPVAGDPGAGEAGPSSASSPDRVARADLGIRYNGRNYEYRGYRYDQLADAMSYAKLDRARRLQEPAAAEADPVPFQNLRTPTSAERELMRELAITFQDGIYRLRGYRYDRLADAIAYARRPAG